MADPGPERPPDPASLLALLGRGTGTVSEVFVARCRASAARPFLIADDRRWSYAEAEEIVRRVAGYLATVAGPAERVASFVGNRPEALWTWFGAAWAGLVYLPINREQRGELLADQLGRSGASVLVTEAAAVADLPEGLGALGIRLVLLLDQLESLPVGWPPVVSWSAVNGAAPIDPVRRGPGDLAAIMFTSGTTGRSKAARLPHNLFVRNAARLVDGYRLRGDDVFHNWLPLCHLGGLLHMTMTAVIAGGTVALFPGFSASRFREQVDRTNATVICGFASILHFIWAQPPRADDPRCSLRVGIIGGIPGDLKRPFEERFGMWLGENYGMTEADPITLPTPGVDAADTSGYPGGDFEVTVVDQYDRPAAPGALGEILIRPRVPSVMSLGYEGDDDATVIKWRNLWFHTGDWGELDGLGRLRFKGRAHHYIRRRGENVSVAEVERILGQHPAVADCVVVGVASPVGEQDVKAVVAVRPGARCDGAELRDYLVGRMAGFMVPRFIEFRAELGRTELGKVSLESARAITGDLFDGDQTAE